ncbi:proline dehydrogenase family protein [Lysinibacillus agricola]|uniref:proline dehydrogenase n=1 Tax=Lysinibacillus agricola TaxID=2590012 RepID=A0ABX7AVI7_9BACI|nr:MULTISPECIES: proline dehydrogenase family protein [Lysinibacillus]KOS63204.1 proline dehydrogenase [Lysinibacillus sp. FJAT-14222]QQP12229.1 proline dehydrogenase family protein [Lysinibacillus agricola]
MKKTEELVIQALKSAARNERMKHSVQQSTELYPLLLKAAKRYVTGEKRQDAIPIAREFIAKDYQISIEFIGENTTDLLECQRAKDEFLQLIEDMGTLAMKQTVSFDLSHIGLSVNAELAYKHLVELAQKANQYEITLMISMEESSKTSDILDIYKKIASQYSNVGITLQVHLYRTEEDIQQLIQYPGKIRLVKGAFQEPIDVALKRSAELNERYLHYAEQLINANHPISIATHDEALIQEMEQRQYFNQPNVEIEMLYGIRPDLIHQLKAKGYRCKVYLPYGSEWYLYLCHRLAEYPENLFLAVADIINPSMLIRSEDY